MVYGMAILWLEIIAGPDPSYNCNLIISVADVLFKERRSLIPVVDNMNILDEQKERILLKNAVEILDVAISPTEMFLWCN